ncbi:MAG: type II secretion system major pseudopilin GspG, partial [Undibacterium sp.]|uniref:type II secretion system major pseudopilin GspG n=1 Tax=Undibacterium sp. TaxID=1914977 RepID=UPI002719CD20
MRSKLFKQHVLKRATGFTLLEMLVVMVIIGLLAGLVGPRIFGKVDSSKVQTAQTQIKMLESALNIMRLDVGQVPPPEQGLQWLLSSPLDTSLQSLWKGPYIEGVIPMDPWNNPYQYAIPGPDNKPYAVYSFGADGKPGGEGLNADIGLGT